MGLGLGLWLLAIHIVHNSVIIFPYFSRGLIEAKRTEGMNYIKPAAMIPVDTTVNESSFGS